MARALDVLARQFRGSGAGLRAGAAAAALYIRLVNETTRWRIEGREQRERLLAEDRGIIIAAWHGRLFLSPCWGARDRHLVGMISANRDGELFAGVLARFGIGAIRGSSYDAAKARDKGGARAYRAARRALSRSAILGMTPDGPRGPLMRAQPGVARLSIETGCPVQPVTFSTRHGRVLGSWDRFLVPVPFDRGVQIWGEPLHPPAGGDPAAEGRYLAEIEAALTSITLRADELCGRASILPSMQPEPAPMAADRRRRPSRATP